MRPHRGAGGLYPLNMLVSISSNSNIFVKNASVGGSLDSGSEEAPAVGCGHCAGEIEVTEGEGEKTGEALTLAEELEVDMLLMLVEE